MNRLSQMIAGVMVFAATVLFLCGLTGSAKNCQEYCDSEKNACVSECHMTCDGWTSTCTAPCVDACMDTYYTCSSGAMICGTTYLHGCDVYTSVYPPDWYLVFEYKTCWEL